MTVQVWTGDGTYVGQVVVKPGHQLDVDADDEEEREKIKQALLSGKNSHFMRIRIGVEKQELEFPGEDWLAIAAVLRLPREGYRVHVVMESHWSL